MGISYEKESKAKTWIGVALAIGGAIYSANWVEATKDLPTILAYLSQLAGVVLAATGKSVTKS